MVMVNCIRAPDQMIRTTMHKILLVFTLSSCKEIPLLVSKHSKTRWIQNALGHVMQPFFLISKHLERVKELDDVSSSADVAEQKLGKLISRHLALEWKVFWVGGLQSTTLAVD